MGGDGSLLGGKFPSGYLTPDQEAILHESAVILCSETVSFGVKMIRDRTKSRKEPLCMPRGCGSVASCVLAVSSVGASVPPDC